MNLKYELPQICELELRKHLSGEEILYCLPYDLNERNSYVDGYFVITKSRIFIFCDGLIINIMKISDASDYKCVDLVSSGRLECTVDGESHTLVYFNMEHLPRYFYAMRILNELSQGDMPKVVSTDESDKCPKCGRSFLSHTKICPHCISRTSSFKKIAKIIKPHIFIYIAITVLFVLNSLVMLIMPVINQNIIDKAIVPKSFGLLIFYIAAIALCNLSVSAIDVGKQILSAKAGASLSKDLRTLVYNKVQELSISYVDEQTVGNIMNRISHDTGDIQHFIQNIATQALNEIFLLFGVLVILFISDPKMAVLAIIPMPFVLIFCGICHDRMHKMYRNQWRKIDKLNSFLNDILRGIRVVKAFGQENRAVNQFRDDAYSVCKITIKNECFAYTIIPAIKFIMTIGGFLITFYGANSVLNGNMSIGELLKFSTYASYLYARLEWFSMLPRWLSEATSSIERIFEVLDRDPEITDSKKPVSNNINGNVVLENVTFGYKSYKPVLNNVSVDVKAGEMIGLVGHSGAGKSTVINLLMRLYDADEGHITIDGVDLKELMQNEYKNQIGVVLQETFLFSGTILENIRYAKPDASTEDVIKAAKIANAHDFIVSFPDGYDTKVGERGQRLSGGERQRIAIARAVLTNPKILILDEATASVDTETEQLIQQALSRLIKGRTTFAIAHRLSTLKNADRIMVMDHGKLAELGTHDELMQLNGIYHNLVMAQHKMSAIKAL